MAPPYINHPDIKITLGGVEYVNSIGSNITVTRLENGFDTAQVIIGDTQSHFYPNIVTTGTVIEVEVKDKSTSTYPTNPLFNGVVRFPIIPYTSQAETLILKCDGTGYGFGDTVCAQEYGTQSSHPALNTLKTILTDATDGVVPLWVNKQLGNGATASGFSYTTTGVQDILTGTVPYQVYPYKPNNKVLDDLCDILCALGAGSTAGPHWIVTTDNDLHVKLISSTQAGWDLYYGGAAATSVCDLYQGLDLIDYKFEKIGPEANFIVYYGAWRRPSNGDMLTENNATDWTVIAPVGCTVTDDTDAGDFRVNTASILITGTSAANVMAALYQTGGAPWNYDFSGFREYNTPSLNFWAKRNATLAGAQVRLSDNAGANYYWYSFFADMPNANTWYHITLPCGPFYKGAGTTMWTENGAPDWTDIDYVSFIGSSVVGATLHIDGLHFGDAWVCRGALNSTNITANKLKIKTITDNVGKDDSLVAATATGLMAQMAYAELLRSQTTNLVGYVTTPLIGDVLPGQRFRVYAKKTVTGSYQINGTVMRATKIEHHINSRGGTTTMHLTDDVLNSHPRSFYDDWNKVMAATRPEFQDRQTTSMKAGHVDIRVPRLDKDYP